MPLKDLPVSRSSDSLRVLFDDAEQHGKLVEEVHGVHGLFAKERCQNKGQGPNIGCKEATRAWLAAIQQRSNMPIPTSHSDSSSPGGIVTASSILPLPRVFKVFSCSLSRWPLCRVGRIVALFMVIKLLAGTYCDKP